MEGKRADARSKAMLVMKECEKIGADRPRRLAGGSRDLRSLIHFGWMDARTGDICLMGHTYEAQRHSCQRSWNEVHVGHLARLIRVDDDVWTMGSLQHYHRSLSKEVCFIE
jgi:hypothetical protein